MNRHFLLEPGGLLQAVELDDTFFQHEGIFTTFRVEPDGTVMAWDKHLARLRQGCDFFGYPWPDVLNREASSFFALASRELPVVRIAVIPREAEPMAVVVSLRPMPDTPLALRLALASYDRVFPGYKHLLPGPEQWMLPQIRAEGWDDYLRTNQAGMIAEACYANVFGVTQADTLITPDPEAVGCLPGIMRQGVLEACEALGVVVETRCFSVEKLATLKGVFLTNVVRGLMPVAEVADYRFEPEAIAPLLARINSGLHSRSRT